MKRLQVDHLGVYLLDRPEQLLQAKKGIQRAELYEKMGIAFAWLNSQVKSGRITSFGVASNTIHDKLHPHHLDLATIHSLGGPNFKNVQYPFNVYERQSLDEGFDGSPSLSDVVAENNLFAMAQRPLYCITKRGVVHLSRRSFKTDQEVNDNLLASCQRLVDIEYQILQLLPIDYASNQLTWNTNIMDNFSRLTESALAAEVYFERDVIPAMRADIENLKLVANKMDSAYPESVLILANGYETILRRFMECIVNVAHHRQDADNLELNEILGKCEGISSEDTISKNALKAAMSIFDGTVLVGMRTPEYVKEVLSIKELPQPDEIEDTLKHLN